MFVDKHNLVKLLINDYNLLRFAKPSDKRINQKDYQYTIDNIIYVVNYIRFDIVFAIERLN